MFTLKSVIAVVAFTSPELAYLASSPLTVVVEVVAVIL